MRSNTLLFLHIVVGMILLGGLLATAIAALAAQRLVGARAATMRSVSWWSALVTAASAVAVVALGEGLAAQEDIEDAGWLDVSRALATIGLLVGGVVLAILARLAQSRPRLAGAVGWLGLALALIALAVTFLMSAKPGSERRATEALTKPLRKSRSFAHRRGIPSWQMSSFAIDLTATSGFLVADRRGRVVGRVESPMYGTRPDEPDALAVRTGLFSRRRLVPADTIDSIDGATGVIGLSVEREAIRTFL